MSFEEAQVAAFAAHAAARAAGHAAARFAARAAGHAAAYAVKAKPAASGIVEIGRQRTPNTSRVASGSVLGRQLDGVKEIQ